MIAVLERKVKSRAKRSARLDPTRTMGLRARFVKAMDKRFKSLLLDIKTSVVDKDCFGLSPKITTLAPAERFVFRSDSQKIVDFVKWLEREESRGILQRVGQENWFNAYIDSAYLQGMRRGRAELDRVGLLGERYGSDPLSSGSILAAFHGPLNVETVSALYTRTFEDLKTVTSVMNSDLRRTISDGLRSGISQAIAEGRSVESATQSLMQDIARGVNKIGIDRARLIARTETVRAHHQATMTEYRQIGADIQVDIMAELSTANDADVCEECDGLARSGPYSLEKADGLIPVHPNCRCCAVPVVPEEVAPSESRTPPGLRTARWSPRR
jgi:hypothetical protein